MADKNYNYESVPTISSTKVGNTKYYLKDAEARTALDTLLNNLKTAAYADLQATWDASKTSELPTVSAVKSYVDAQVQTIHSFDVVVCGNTAETIPAGAVYKKGTTSVTGTMPATANTMYKLYLVANDTSGAGSYVEWLSIRSGSEGAYTYSWESIGNTSTMLEGYVQDTRTIAGIDLKDDISVAELEEALNLGELAHKNSGKVAINPYSLSATAVDVINDVTLNDLTQTATAATVATSAYTPEGVVDGGKVIASGTVALDAAIEATPATLNKETYIPTGTISAATTDGSFSALKTATFQADSTNGIAIEGSNSASAVTIDPAKATFIQSLKASTTKAASFTEGAFTPASIQNGFYTAGTAATWTGAAYTAPSLGNASTSKFASKVLKPSIADDDTECLVFDYVDSTDTTVGTSAFADAVTAQGAFTAGNVDFGTFDGGSATVIDTTKFNGGAKAADTFSAEFIPEADATADAVTGINSATAAAQVFTGSKYSINTTADTALKNAVFTATNNASIVTGVTYDRTAVNGATFTGSEVAVTGAAFTGTKAEGMKVTGVTYDKATANGVTTTTESVAKGDIKLNKDTAVDTAVTFE